MAEIRRSLKQSPDAIDSLLDEILQLIEDKPSLANSGRKQCLSTWVRSTGKKVISSLAELFCHRNGEKIEDFYFKFIHSPEMSAVIDLSVLYATRSHAENLYLNFITEGSNVAGNATENTCYKLLPSAFDEESLISLRVAFCGPKPYRLTPLNAIQVQFQRVKLTNHAIYGVTSTIPVLIQLTLIDCNRERDLHIDIAPNSYFSTLTILEHFSEVKHESQMYINAPSARQIIFLGSMPRADYGLENISEGTEVCLCFDEMFEVCREDGPNILVNDFKVLKYEKVLQGLLASVQHAKSLHMGNWCIQILSLGELRNSERVTLNCTKLRIATSFRDLELPGINYMLKACPALAELILETPPIDKEIKIPQDSPIQHHSQEDNTFIFIDHALRDSLLNLKAVTFKVTRGDFQTWEDGNFDMCKFFNERRAGMKLVMLLRANTLNLERMVFATSENKFIYEVNSHNHVYHTLGN